MKYLLIYFLAPFLLTLTLASCSTSSDVVSDRGFQKRKYRKGYFVVKSDQKPEAETAYIEPVEIDPTVKTIDTERKTPALQTNIECTPAIQKPITTKKALRNNLPKNESFPTEVDNNQYHNLASVLKAHTPKFEIEHA
ncbi:MAG: hypothetical protein NWR73_02860 [Flavobacteriales bacterium]|nr:hypothetical protein [Flavobacteriales bacterium]